MRKLPPLLMIFSLAALAQPAAHIVSPEVQGDGRVTFRFLAPNAIKTEIVVEGEPKPVPMEKDQNGIWSATVGPLQPDVYGYAFIADGVRLIDPNNPLMQPNLLGTDSAVHVPGPKSLPWEVNNVSHGEIHHHFFHSEIAGDDRDFYVYTPPNYDPRAKKEYPVLYLLHGFSDDASGWTSVGYSNVILDNMIAQGKAKPMIVVMPLGYGDLEVIHRGWRSSDDKDLERRNFSRFTDILLREIMPRIEAAYQTKNNPDSRAIAGLSMGGAESLFTGLNHLETFTWIGAFSSGGIGDRVFEDEFPELSSIANHKLKLLWIACGTEDSLIKVNREFKVWLKGKGVQFTDIETPGMHSWMVWRRNLASLAQLLFQSAP